MDITDALIIDEPWISKILRGEKIWELRSTHCHKRGWVGLIRKGSGLVVGVARVVDSVGPLSESELAAAEQLHHVSAAALMAMPKYRFAWVLNGARVLGSPVPYQHPFGAVKWIRLAPEVARAVVLQLEDGDTTAHQAARPSVAKDTVHASAAEAREAAPRAPDMRREAVAVNTGSGAAASAEAWLAARFPRTRAPTKYIAGFDIGGGRELALERSHRAIQVWISAVPAGLQGYRILNPVSPGQPYAATQTRNSNLRSATPTLAEKHVAYHLQLDDLGVLEKLVAGHY